MSPENVVWEARRQPLVTYMAGHLLVIDPDCFRMFSHIFKYLGYLEGGGGSVDKIKKHRRDF